MRRPVSTEEAELLSLDISLLRFCNKRRIKFQFLKKEVQMFYISTTKLYGITWLILQRPVCPRLWTAVESMWTKRSSPVFGLWKANTTLPLPWQRKLPAQPFSTSYNLTHTRFSANVSSYCNVVFTDTLLSHPPATSRCPMTSVLHWQMTSLEFNHLHRNIAVFGPIMRMRNGSVGTVIRSSRRTVLYLSQYYALLEHAPKTHGCLSINGILSNFLL